MDPSKLLLGILKGSEQKKPTDGSDEARGASDTHVKKSVPALTGARGYQRRKVQVQKQYEKPSYTMDKLLSLKSLTLASSFPEGVPVGESRPGRALRRYGVLEYGLSDRSFPKRPRYKKKYAGTSRTVPQSGSRGGLRAGDHKVDIDEQTFGAGNAGSNDTSKAASGVEGLDIVQMYLRMAESWRRESAGGATGLADEPAWAGAGLSGPAVQAGGVSLEEFAATTQRFEARLQAESQRTGRYRPEHAADQAAGAHDESSAVSKLGRLVMSEEAEGEGYEGGGYEGDNIYSREHVRGAPASPDIPGSSALGAEQLDTATGWGGTQRDALPDTRAFSGEAAPLWKDSPAGTHASQQGAYHAWSSPGTGISEARRAALARAAARSEHLHGHGQEQADLARQRELADKMRHSHGPAAVSPMQVTGQSARSQYLAQIAMLRSPAPRVPAGLPGAMTPPRTLGQPGTGGASRGAAHLLSMLRGPASASPVQGHAQSTPPPGVPHAQWPTGALPPRPAYPALAGVPYGSPANGRPPMAPYAQQYVQYGGIASPQTFGFAPRPLHPAGGVAAAQGSYSLPGSGQRGGAGGGATAGRGPVQS